MIEQTWYGEDAGFFGPRYLDEYRLLLPPEQTRLEVAFVETFLHLKRGMKILDLACGYGRHAVELAADGFEVTGQDVNRWFLEEAERRARERGVSVRWVPGDMRDIGAVEEYDAVISMFTSFGYLESEAEDARVVAEVASALKPGGVFLLDFVNREWLFRYYTPRSWVELEDGSVILQQQVFQPASGRNVEHRTRIGPDGGREEMTTSLRVYAPTELTALCSAAGLVLEDAYGGYMGEAFDLQSPRALQIYRKPSEASRES